MTLLNPETGRAQGAVFGPSFAGRFDQFPSLCIETRDVEPVVARIG